MSMNGVRVIVASVVLALGVGGTTASAAPPVARSSSKAVTIESVGKMLADLGYEVRPARDDDGHVFGHLISVMVGNSNVELLVNLSPNQNVIWFTMALKKFDDPAALEPEMLAALLRFQFQAGGTTTFALSKDNMLLLESWDLAASLTAERLKSDIHDLIQHARESRDLLMSIDAGRTAK
jgi:hypothetical protein